MTQPPNPVAAPVAAPTAATSASTRRALVASAARAWEAQLVDLSGRNRLLYYRDQKVGTLDLAGAAPGPLETLLSGTKTRLSALFPDPATLADAARRCRTIRGKARENLEERGIDTLYVARSEATWTPPPGTAAVPAAPVLLCRLELVPRGSAEEDFELDLAGDPELNPTLLFALEASFGVRTDRHALEASAVPPEGEGIEVGLLSARLAEVAAAVPGFAVGPRTVVGNFSYTKLPMVTDLQVHADALAAHDLVAAIAGDAAAQRAVRDRQSPVEPLTLDAVPPAAEFLVLDADASQQAVIETVVRGSDSVVQGPPGTGKSQTIANLIASATAQGLRVLFVAEKRAAIDAVVGRLDRTGLSDLVLDLHGGVSSRRRLAENLAAALGAARATAEPESATVEGFLEARRTVLAAHARGVNERRDPWGISLYAAQARSVAARRLGLDVRLSPAAVDRITADRLDALKEALRAYLALGAADLADGTHAWSAARTVDAGAVEALSDAATDLARDELPRLIGLAKDVAAEAGLPGPGTAAAGFEQALVLDERARLAASVRDEAFDQAPRLSPLLEPARRGWFARLVAQVTSAPYRAALAEARALLTSAADARAAAPAASPAAAPSIPVSAAAAAPQVGPRDTAAPQVGPRDVAARMAAAAALVTRWSAAGGTSRPPVLGRAPELRGAWERVTARMSTIGAVLPLPGASATSLEALGTWARALDADLPTLRKLPELQAHLAAMTEAGLGELVAAVTARHLGVDDAVAALDGAWAGAIVERVLARDAAVGGVDAGRLDQESVSYGGLDRDHVTINAARVKRAWAERAVAARDAFPEQDLLVSAQAKRKIGHLPVRDLFAAAPDVLTAVKPCWAMSPLLVSQILPADRPYFDLVVFDEASQILPADAIPSILRGRRAVVAGDDLQLPPTIFFASQTALDLEDEQEAAGLEGAGEVLATGFASILDIADPLIGSRPLRWHYRSRDERLIAFSNLQIYRPKHRELTTFPAVTDDECIRHVRVEARPEGASGESSKEEVDAVVRLVLEHAQERPEESLGVIAMGLKHADRISEALRLARAGRPDLDDVFAEGGREPLFIKNLERVQGDERDAIILTIGYGRTAGGRLVHNFGPVNQEGGERRLNVAITRARRRMVVVSSFGSEDVDPARSSSEGVRLLRSYLRYAETGGADLGGMVPTRPELNGFERDVLVALGELGIGTVPQLGTSGYYLDYALQHPAKPGRFVLAVECDGASYHSAPNTRERDRLRQQQLEAIGWRFHRIWSTDWYRARDREVARLKAAYEGAVAAVDAAAAAAERAAFEAQVTADVVAARAATLVSPAGPVQPVQPVAPVQAPVPPPPTVPVQPPPAPIVISAPARGPRPRVFSYGSINGMPPSQIDAVVAWIESDGLLRTSDEVVAEAMRELGFARRGPRIVAAIDASVARTRARREG